MHEAETVVKLKVECASRTPTGATNDVRSRQAMLVPSEDCVPQSASRIDHEENEGANSEETVIKYSVHVCR